MLLIFYNYYRIYSRISCPPKNRVRMWSKIIELLISRRWFLRTCTGCKLQQAIVCTGRRLQPRRDRH